MTCILIVSCACIAGRAWRAAKWLPYSMQLPIPSGQSTYSYAYYVRILTSHNSHTYEIAAWPRHIQCIQHALTEFVPSCIIRH
jgi:hypothetical protein